MFDPKVEDITKRGEIKMTKKEWQNKFLKLIINITEGTLFMKEVNDEAVKIEDGEYDKIISVARKVTRKRYGKEPE